MASAFDLFGTLNLETKAFENSVRRVADRLKATDSALDQTIARSNKLGDTSATVARRYEKLAEGIAAQKARLLDNALAFEKGEINAKKFSSVITSVDKSVSGLNSRLRDAKARVQELDDVGLTHFQQQISGAVQDANAKLQAFRQTIVPPPAPPPAPPDLLKSLSGYQKRQLSFQLNDIITGLASGQSPFQILAQQGGQIVQTFQMGKVAQEGTAAATAAAAASEAAFAASAKGAAVSQEAVAVSAAATATSMEGAAASATVLGASVVSLGAILAAGAVAILTVWKLSKEIVEAAEAQLKLEEKITGQYNKQALLAGELAKLRKEAVEKRAFDLFTSTAPPELQAGRQNELLAQYNAAVAEAADLRRKAAGVGEADQRVRSQMFLGDWLPPNYNTKLLDQLSSQADAAEKRAQSFYDAILQLDEGLGEAQKRRIEQDAAITKFAENAKLDALKTQFEAEKKYAEERKKMVDEAIKKAKEWVEHVKGAKKEIENIYSSTSDNPFVRIFSEGQKAVERMMEATKGLDKGLQAQLKTLIDSNTEAKAYGQSLDNALRVLNLRDQAAEFRAGKFSTESVSEKLARQLKAIGGGVGFSSQTYEFLNGMIGNVLSDRRQGISQEEKDKRIIALTQGLDPSKLTPQQNQIAAAAREREAGRIAEEEKAAKLERKQLLETLQKLEAAISSGTIITVLDESNGKAKIQTGTPALVKQRY